MAALFDEILKRVFFNENMCILIEIRKGSTDNKSASVQLMAQCRTGDKPLSGPIITTHISFGLDELTFKTRSCI